MSNYKPVLWIPTDNVEQHQDMFDKMMGEVGQSLVLPEDKRVEIAAAALAMSGPEASVLAIGTPGGGKTRTGSMLLGADRMVTVEETDTAQSLMGYARPTDGEINEGRLAANMLTGTDVRVYLNEVNHIDNTGSLHGLWDASKMTLPTGKEVDMTNAAIYLSGNFPNGKRVKPFDDAMLSRVAMTVIYGDTANGMTSQIQGIDLSQRSASADTPNGLLPNERTRQAVRETVMDATPLDSSAVQLTDAALRTINQTGVFNQLSPTDARIGQGWQQTARARRLAIGEAVPVAIEGSDRFIRKAITAQDYARVGALTLGGRLELTSQAKAELSDLLGLLAAPTELQKAIMVRRILAQMLYRTLTSIVPEAGKAQPVDSLETHLQRYAFADLDGANFPMPTKEANSVLVGFTKARMAGTDEIAKADRDSDTGDTDNGSASRRRRFRRNR